MIGISTESDRRWHRHETRTIRPFRSATDYLEEVGLRLHSEAEFSMDPVLLLTRIDPDLAAPQVLIPAIPAELEELVGVPRADLELLISVEDRFFKNTVVAARVPLERLPEGVLELNSDALREVGWAGAKIHVAVILAKDRDGEVGTAQRAGAWIGRKTFHIVSPRDTHSFHITSVDSGYFVRRGLPENTTYLVEILDEDLDQPSEHLFDLVKVSVHEQVHAALAKDENSLVSKAFVMTIYVDVVTTVLTTGFRSAKGELLTDGILDLVSRRLSEASGIPVAALRAVASETSGARLRAVVQATADLTRAVVNAARRRSV